MVANKTRGNEPKRGKEATTNWNSGLTSRDGSAIQAQHPTFHYKAKETTRSEYSTIYRLKMAFMGVKCSAPRRSGKREGIA